ncbi:hypothetical protein TNIN_191281 [Trichonephila inaurata madagascariensis]|uniref:Uncharacterized protein n=1 Tax=Trichonephila inaurata madagascariensis TaxID=2747483 RepID=A0A8X7C949_9ARAC|nr:hypothetical protein TNIN_191281 [Trichonephila inaurata madagascariensis]
MRREMILLVESGVEAAKYGMVLTGFAGHKKSSLQKSRIKTLLIVFLDSNDMIYTKNSSQKSKLSTPNFMKLLEVITAAHPTYLQTVV